MQRWYASHCHLRSDFLITPGKIPRRRRIRNPFLCLADLRQHYAEDLLGGGLVTGRHPRGARFLRVVLGVVAHQGRQSYGALRAPLREPGLWDLLGRLVVGDGGPERSPGARDYAPDVVAPAAGCDPTTAAELVGEVVHAPRDMLVEVGRCGEVGQGVEGVSVAAVLREDQVRLERAKNAGDDGLEAGDAGLVVRKGFQQHVDGEAGPRAPARLPDLSGPGKEVPARLVHGDGQDVRVVVEHPLHPVAVVCIGVYVGDADAWMVLLEARDGGARVVVDAEAAPLRSQGVVKPARDANRWVRPPRHHEPPSGEHPTDDAGAG